MCLYYFGVCDIVSVKLISNYSGQVLYTLSVSHALETHDEAVSVWNTDPDTKCNNIYLRCKGVQPYRIKQQLQVPPTITSIMHYHFHLNSN